ncbi:MAG: hypothetical protein ABH846_04970 [Patescibacteria group bacterium]
MAEKGTPTPERRRKASPETKIDEERRPFLEKKLAQYEERLKAALIDMYDTDPEKLEEWEDYYDIVIKKIILEYFLEEGEINRDDLIENVVTTVNFLWRGNIPASHDSIIEKALENAIGVIEAYNEGTMGKVVGSEKVDE